MGVDDPVDLRDLGGGIVGYRAMLQVAAGIDMSERAVVHLQVFAFLAEREAQHDLARLRQPAVADQRFHFLDMIAICGLDAQVRAQIMRETIVGVERDGGVAMRFGCVQRPGHSLGRRQIEQVLRHVGAGGDRALEEFLRPRVQAEQAEDRPAGVERFGGVADHRCSGLGGLERRARASPETNRHFARRISAIGSFGINSTARLAQMIAASGRPRSSAVSVRSAQAVPSPGARASISEQIRSTVARSPLANARRASLVDGRLACRGAVGGKRFTPS